MANKQQESKGKYFDYSFLFIVIFLLGFGLVMVYSTSSYSAYLEQGDGLFYFKKQLLSVIIGIIVMFIVSFIPYKLYYKFAVVAYVLSIISVLLVLTPLGHTSHGARRWLRIGGLSLQPAEIAKIGVLLITAFIIEKYKDYTDKERDSFKYIFFVMTPAIFAAGLIYVITDNFSSAFIVLGIAYMMLILANPRCFKAYVLLTLAALAVAVFVLVLKTNIDKTIDMSDLGFRSERVLAWMNPEKFADGKGYQTLQGLYGIGSGGVWGKGLGRSMQKLGFLPEAQNDMIFSIICEELGLFGGVGILLMFMLMLYRIVDVANLVPKFYGNLLLAGIFSHIAIQVVLNVAVVTNIMPNTGISLPFISYGGSSVIFLLIEMGIVMNVGKEADFEKYVADKERKKSKKKARKNIKLVEDEEEE